LLDGQLHDSQGKERLGVEPPAKACSFKFAAATWRIGTKINSAFYQITLVLVLFQLISVVFFTWYRPVVWYCRASMAGSAVQIVLPLAFIIWLMRRSGMMGVSYNFSFFRLSHYMLQIC